MSLRVSAFFQWLIDQGFEPEMMEEDEEIVICCPICQDSRPRLYVNASSGAFTCFHCHEEGSFHQFLMRVGDMGGSEAFALSRDLVMEDGEIDWFEVEARPQKAAPSGNLTLPASFKSIDTDTPDVILKYLARRHISPELARSRGLGYATSGRYAWRVIVPVENDGKLYTFIARTILTQCPNCTERLDDCTCQPRRFPKVLTPPSKDGAAPRHTLFNLDAVSRSASRRVVVVEGVFDALRLPNEAVALMGSSASATQITLLAGLARGRDCVLALDGDSAGYHGALKIADALISQMVGVKVALLPEGSDPGSLPKPDLRKALDSARKFIL